MTSRLTYNVHSQNIPDRLKFFDHLTKLQPAAVVVMDDVKTARDIKALLPDCTVIFRWNGDGGDGGIYLRMMPAPWLRMMTDKLGGDKRIMLYTNNESGLPRRLIAWLAELIPLANASGQALCVLNLQTGNPKPEVRDDKGNITQESEWEVAEPLLKLLAVNRQHILGLHEYFGAVPTSGLYGGYPDNAGVQPGKPGGKHLIQPENWPKEVSTVTRYHLGRFKFLLDYCDRHNIAYPRIGLTETGADDTSDIKAYLDTLRKTPPYLNIRGYKTLRNQWQDWYGARAWTMGRTLGEMLVWADRTIYQNSPVEFQAVFCWGHSSDDWTQFDVAEDVDYQNFMVKNAHQEAAPVFPLPTDKRWVPSENFSGENYRIRLVSQVDDKPELGWVKAGEKFSYIGIEGNQTWMYAKNHIGVIGYISRDVLNIEPPKEPGQPAPEPPLDDAIVFNTIVLQNLIRKQVSEIERKQETLAFYRRMVDLIKGEIAEDLSFLESLDLDKSKLIKESLEVA